jgi:hypothetical protein
MACFGASNPAGKSWDSREGRYVKSLKRGTEEFAKNPHVVGITRELEFGRPGSWVGRLFDYHSPRFHFSSGE